VRERPPFFSIIIPTFGRHRQLLGCLQSIAQLDYPLHRFEVIVVDDGSEPPVDAEVASRFDQIDVTVVRQEHAGPATARNTGAGRARGRFLAFTDDDCRPAADWLRALADRLDARPSCGVGGRTLNLLVDNLCSTASQMLIGYLYTYYNAAPDRARFLTSNNLALPADVFHALGGFDTTFTRTAGEDRELCDRWRHCGHHLVYAPEAVVYHAHQLTLRSYWRQHFRYGRGAHQFRRARSQRTTEPLRVEPVSFYAGIVRHPFSHSRGLGPSSLLAGLLILSQVANAAGFVCEGTSVAVAKAKPE
jgi:cellulose synthase/poly-beta-1,6-N-acetylglucosamine synthase-like glycosyltransferase